MAEKPEKSILGKLSGFLFGTDGTPDRVAARQKPIIPASSAATTLIPSRMPAGTLQLIGLDRIQTALGEAWPAQSERIHQIAESVLRRRLDVTDAYYRVENDNYLVLFTRLRRREAEFKARVIAEELRKLIVGEVDGSEDMTVISNVTEVDRALVLEKIHTLPELVAYIRSAAQQEEDFLFGDGPASGEREARPLIGPGPDLADLDQSLAGLFERKTIAEFLKECRAGFYPAFSIKHQGFTSYQVSAMHVPSGTQAQLVADPLVDDPEELSFQIDRYLLTTGLLGVHRMLTNKQQGSVVMSVGFETLANGRLREAYFARLKEIPSGVTRFLGISMRNIPPGTPASRIAEALAYVQPLTAVRLLRIEPDIRLIDQYANTGCHGFSTSVPQDELDIGKTLQALSAFAKRAALHRLECVLVDANSHEDVSVGVTAGFTYLSGEAVAGMIETPGYVEKSVARHLLRPMPSA